MTKIYFEMGEQTNTVMVGPGPNNDGTVALIVKDLDAAGTKRLVRMTPDEAEQVADLLKKHARETRNRSEGGT